MTTKQQKQSSRVEGEWQGSGGGGGRGGKGARRGRREYIINKDKEAKRMIAITKESVLLLSLQ